MLSLLKQLRPSSFLALPLSSAVFLTACGGGGGGSGISSCPDCPTADLAGFWAVTATVSTVDGIQCNEAAVGAVFEDELSISHFSETGIRVDDGFSEAFGEVIGNTASFEFSAFGATETWDLVVAEDKFEGTLGVESPDCAATGTVRGTRVPVSESLVFLPDDGLAPTFEGAEAHDLGDGTWLVYRADGSQLLLSRGSDGNHVFTDLAAAPGILTSLILGEIGQ